MRRLPIQLEASREIVIFRTYFFFVLCECVFCFIFVIYYSISMNFEIQMDHQIPARSLDLVSVNFYRSGRAKKKKKTIDKYLDISRWLKTLWEMRLTVIPTVIGALGTVSKCFEFEIGGRIETILTMALIKLPRKLRRILDT